jgi:hypothetical protein
MSDTAIINKCVICEEPAPRSAFPSRNTLTRRWIDDEGQVQGEHEQLPPYHLCDEHMRQLARGTVRFGWCDDATCRRWGRLCDISPCGEPY